MELSDKSSRHLFTHGKRTNMCKKFSFGRKPAWNNIDPQKVYTCMLPLEESACVFNKTKNSIGCQPQHQQAPRK